MKYDVSLMCSRDVEKKNENKVGISSQPTGLTLADSLLECGKAPCVTVVIQNRGKKWCN